MVVFSNIFLMLSPNLGEDEPDLTIVLFRMGWFKTTNGRQKLIGIWIFGYLYVFLQVFFCWGKFGDEQMAFLKTENVGGTW